MTEKKAVHPEEVSIYISVFLSAVQSYRTIAEGLPLSDALRRFHGDVKSTSEALAQMRDDSIAIDARLMLQRKFFAYGQNVNLKALLQAAIEAVVVNQNQASSLIERLTDLNEMPINLSLPDGTSLNSSYDIAEKIIYGLYLHADIDKMKQVLSLSPQLKLLATAPFVIAREDLLYCTFDFLVSEGYSPMSADIQIKAGALCWGDPLDEKKEIRSSSYWLNFFGHDTDEEEIASIAGRNSLDDNIVILRASRFFQTLCAEGLDIELLHELVWEDYWTDWGDFREAQEAALSAAHPGLSSKVLHEGGDDYAQVKILPNVGGVWVTNTPQLVQSDTYLILFTKRNGVWKVNGMTRPDRRGLCVQARDRKQKELNW